MTLSIDSENNITFAANQSIVPVGTIRAVLILITDNGTSSDNVTGVNINGVAMTELALSPYAPGITEPAVHHAFFMDNVPSGTLDVDFNGSPTQTSCIYVAFSAAGSVEVVDTSTNAAASGTTASVTVNGDATGVYGIAALQSNVGVTSGITPNAGHTQIGGEADYGNQVGGFIRTTNLVTTTPTFSISWTVTSDDWMTYGVTVKEGAAPIQAIAHGRGKGRATATRAAATTQATAHGRAHARSSAVGNTPAIQGAAHGRGKGRSTATKAAATITSSAHGRGKGRATATRAAPTVTAAATNRGRSRARADATASTQTTAQARARGRGYSTAFANQSGTQQLTEHDIWELAALQPVPPATYVENQVTRRRKPVSVLGSVVHTVVGTNGVGANPLIGEWACEDDLFGGYGAASGVLSLEEYQKNQNVLDEGATWRTYHAQTGECLWAGRISELDRHQGGTVSIVGRGWGQILLNRVLREPVLYARYGTEGWIDATGEIGNFGDSNFDWSVSANPGSLIYKREKDPDRTSASQAGIMVLSLPNYDISRIQFYLEASHFSTGSDTEFSFFVMTGTSEKFDDSGATTTVYGQDNIIIPDDVGDRYRIEYDIPLNEDNSLNGGPGDPLDYNTPNDWVAIGVNGETQGLTNGVKVSIRDLRVFGEPLQTNELTGGQLVADIFSRLGHHRTDYIENCGPDLLPFEIAPGTKVAEVLEFVSMMARRTVGLRGERPIPYFSEPGERRWWVFNEHYEADIVPEERFDTILVPYSVGTEGEVVGYRRVRLDPSPLERHNNFGALDWPFPIRFRQTSGAPFGADDQRAEDLGVSVLRQLSKARYTGQATLTEIVGPDGVPVSARFLQAGDMVRFTHGITASWLLVSKVRQSDNRVDVEFDNMAEMLVERKRAKRELKANRKLG